MYLKLALPQSQAISKSYTFCSIIEIRPSSMKGTGVQKIEI